MSEAIQNVTNQPQNVLDNSIRKSADYRSDVVSEKSDDKVDEQQKTGSSLAKGELQAAAYEISQHVNTIQRNLSFSVDEHSGREVVSVVDASTEELIRQIPSEEALELIKNLDRVNGILFNTEA